jgi:hypothetical protein
MALRQHAETLLTRTFSLIAANSVFSDDHSPGWRRAGAGLAPGWSISHDRSPGWRRAGQIAVQISSTDLVMLHNATI